MRRLTVALLALASASSVSAQPETPLSAAVPATPPPAAPLGPPVAPPPSLRYGPAPGWALRADIPGAGSADAGGAIQVLLVDNQTFLGPDGDETFTHTAVKILNEGGLGALGTFQRSWNPETDVLTLHAVTIRRGAETIDVLRNGQAVTVLRREANLEKASLDGRLTATLQVEGLRLGDIVETSTTLRQHDPALGGFSQADAGLTSPTTITRARFRVAWPDSKPIRWRVVAGLPTPTVSHADGRTELVDDITDASGPRPPVGAPPRYRYRAQLEVTQFADWGQVSALMAPLYDTAAGLKPDSALAAEATAIKASAKTPAERASMALALVQRKVRYEFVGLDDGNYRPAAAEVTWARRYGDCKGKTVLLLALLRELGVEAEPVLVSTGLGDGMDERLPQLAYFDHVLVRVRIGDAFYWLDGTKSADPRDLAMITPPLFKWGLPLRRAGATLIKIEPRQPRAPLSEETTWIDASGGLDAPAPERRLAVTHGDLAMGLGLSINQLPRDQAEKALRDAFASNASSFDLKTIDWTFDADAATFTLRAVGVAHLDWRWNRDIGAREHLLSNVSATAPAGPPKRQPGPDQDAPYAIVYPAWNVRRVLITLPAGGKGFSVVGADSDVTVGAVEHIRRTKLDHGAVTLETSSRNLAPEYPAAEADAVTRYRAEINDDPVAIRAPKGPRPPAT